MTHASTTTATMTRHNKVYTAKDEKSPEKKREKHCEGARLKMSTEKLSPTTWHTRFLLGVFLGEGQQSLGAQSWSYAGWECDIICVDNMDKKSFCSFQWHCLSSHSVIAKAGFICSVDIRRVPLHVTSNYSTLIKDLGQGVSCRGQATRDKGWVIIA